MTVPMLGLALDPAPPPGQTYAGNLRRLRPPLELSARQGYGSICAGESYVHGQGDPRGSTDG